VAAGVAVVAGLLAASVALSSACVESRCIEHEDCPAGLMCVAATGVCSAPECLSDSSCGRGRICDDYLCVPGCVTNDDCDLPRECRDRQCVLVGTGCDCALAGEFCLTQINPDAPSPGAELCIPTADHTARLLFFGSVACSHCRDIYASLLARRDDLRAEGLDARILWMQWKDYPVEPSDIVLFLGENDVEVVADDEATDAWGRMGVFEFYHVIVVDTFGCTAGHWGPVTPAEIDGTLGDDMTDAWRNALEGDCPDPVDPGGAG
jgi:hypothetical protein